MRGTPRYFHYMMERARCVWPDMPWHLDPVLPISLLWLKLGSPLISVAGVLIPGPLSILLTASSR